MEREKPRTSLENERGLLDLPLEVLSMIVSYVFLPRHLLSIRSTCKKLHHAVDVAPKQQVLVAAPRTLAQAVVACFNATRVTIYPERNEYRDLADFPMVGV
eukprot:TRINITY_DN467_c0_g1_i2.p2 TRINITY_DN467_c0_g1~~TRINITY_DN467_c0_g1_i2.p2  ORF type:complete len:101 (-),score=0.37 TRINITY_DN467_c0_g1_i2:930-1232(-)